MTTKYREFLSGLIGSKFNRLTVVGFEEGDRRSVLICKCDCGNEVLTDYHKIKTGNTGSCGCLSRDIVINRNKRPPNIIENIMGVCVMHFDNGSTCIFDKIDYDKVKDIRWCYAGGKNDYVRSGAKNSFTQMHAFIMGKPEIGYCVDHINRDKSDNRRCNLRFVTYSENSQNQPKRNNVGGRYKGVLKRNKSFHSVCKMGGNRVVLGRYKTEEAAAYAWNKYVSQNFPMAILNVFDLSEFELEEKLVSDKLSKHQKNK